jgi:hypothetical protein
MLLVRATGFALPMLHITCFVALWLAIISAPMAMSRRSPSASSLTVPTDLSIQLLSLFASPRYAGLLPSSPARSCATNMSGSPVIVIKQIAAAIRLVLNYSERPTIPSSVTSPMPFNLGATMNSRRMRSAG